MVGGEYIIHHPALLSCQIAERFTNTAKATKPVLAFAGPLAKRAVRKTVKAGFFVWKFGCGPRARTVAGFDRQIAGATHKCWLKSGSPDNRKPFSETTLTRRDSP